MVIRRNEKGTKVISNIKLVVGFTLIGSVLSGVFFHQFTDRIDVRYIGAALGFFAGIVAVAIDFLRNQDTTLTNRISINGVDIVGGRNISIKNGKVIVDGNDVTPESKNITIEVTGNVETLDVGSANTIKISGDCANVESQSGDIICGNVSGDVRSTSGDIDCENVRGDTSTISGDISCHTIEGNAKTVSGDITSRNQSRSAASS